MLVHIRTYRRKIGLRDIVEKGVKVITFIRCIEITTEKQDQFVYHFRLAENIVLQVVVYDIEHETTVNNILLVSILLPENGIARLMECSNWAIDFQGFVNLVTKLTHCFIGE